VLATFCWTKSLLCNVAAFTGMLFYSESTLQLWASRRLYAEFKTISLVPVHPLGRRDILSGRSSVKASSVRTTRTFCPDVPLYPETSNYSRLHPSGRHGNTVRKPFSVRQVIGFLSQTHIWEDNCNRPDDVCYHSDAILDKASCTEEVQPSRHQTPWSERLDLIMEIACNESTTVRTLGQHRSVFWS
jgi:hypothetical protein